MVWIYKKRREGLDVYKKGFKLSFFYNNSKPFLYLPKILIIRKIIFAYLINKTSKTVLRETFTKRR